MSLDFRCSFFSSFSDDLECKRHSSQVEDSVSPVIVSLRHRSFLQIEQDYTYMCHFQWLRHHMKTPHSRYFLHSGDKDLHPQKIGKNPQTRICQFHCADMSFSPRLHLIATSTTAVEVREHIELLGFLPLPKLSGWFLLPTSLSDLPLDPLVV